MQITRAFFLSISDADSPAVGRVARAIRASRGRRFRVCLVSSLERCYAECEVPWWSPACEDGGSRPWRASLWRPSVGLWSARAGARQARRRRYGRRSSRIERVAPTWFGVRLRGTSTSRLPTCPCGESISARSSWNSAGRAHGRAPWRRRVSWSGSREEVHARSRLAGQAHSSRGGGSGGSGRVDFGGSSRAGRTGPEPTRRWAPRTCGSTGRGGAAGRGRVGEARDEPRLGRGCRGRGFRWLERREARYRVHELAAASVEA